MNFASQYRAVREQKKISAQEASNSVGIHRSTIHKIENNERLPRGDMLRRMLKALHLTESSPEWKQLSMAWSLERNPSNMSPGAAAKMLQSAILKNNGQAEDFFKDVSALEDDDFDQLAKAVRRPAVLAIIRAANALYESKP